MIETIQHGLKAEGHEVVIRKLCEWFGLQRRTFYFKSVKSAPKVQECFERPIKAMIEGNPSLGYRTVAQLLDSNKNTVQRIFQLKGWQVRKRPVGFRPCIEAKISRADSSNERWAPNLCRVCAGRIGWSKLALAIDCHTRELLGWQLSRSGKSRTAEIALENALICRFGSLGAAHELFLLRSDNGLVFSSRSHTALIKSCGLRHKFITPYTPQRNGLVERVIRTLKETCIHRHRLETLQNARRAIGVWIQFYNHQRPHQALGMKTPNEVFKLAA